MLNLAASVVLPVFGMILVGFGLGKTRIFNEGAIEGLTGFVWYVAIPALVFRTMATMPTPGLETIELLLAYFLPILAVYAASSLILGRLFSLSLAERGVTGLSVSFGNVGLMGLLISYAAFGDEGLRVALLIMAFHSTMLNTPTIMLLETAKNNGGSRWAVTRSTALSLLRHPVMMSLVLGMAWGTTGWQIPQVLDRLIEIAAQGAVPAALFAVGATLSSVRLAGDVVQASAIAFVKLLIQPLGVFLSAKYVFQLSDLWVAILTLNGTMPVGLNPFVLAKIYEVAPNRVASAVLISTPLSILTVSGLILLLG